LGVGLTRSQEACKLWTLELDQVDLGFLDFQIEADIKHKTQMQTVHIYIYGHFHDWPTRMCARVFG